MGIRHQRTGLSRKQMRFIEEYDRLNGNGVQAAKAAGYSAKSYKSLSVTASRDLLDNPRIIAEMNRRDAVIDKQITPLRVKRRLHEISHSSEAAGQFGPAVRAEELLGKSIGMWVDQTIHLSGQMNDTHIAALIEIARKRQLEPVDLADDSPHNQSTHDDE